MTHTAPCWDDRCLDLTCIADQMTRQLWIEWEARKRAEDADYTAARDEHRRYWRDGPTREQKAAQKARIEAEWRDWTRRSA